MGHGRLGVHLLVSGETSALVAGDRIERAAVEAIDHTCPLLAGDITRHWLAEPSEALVEYGAGLLGDGREVLWRALRDVDNVAWRFSDGRILLLGPACDLLSPREGRD